MSSIRLNNRLISLDTPLVMGIINATPDSFYGNSRVIDYDELCYRVASMIEEGADLLDIGAYSTRPNASFVSVEEEKRRLQETLTILRQEFSSLPPISIDTFRSDIASYCVNQFGVAMINDIGGGTLDPHMFGTIAKLQVPYILMHTTGTPQSMFEEKQPVEMSDLIDFFSKSAWKLRELGVNDLIIDPGFGFGKDLQENYRLINRMDELQVLELPVLVGISRKSMIYKLLDTTPEESLNGTTVLNTIALQKGASILRVHDVKQAKEAVRITCKLST